ncbi:MAG: hypothetical protein H0X34_14060 [Chthoniobacterales bacterium]|nr:hypothetical protein [Chthoniobacterales bacterium]
MNTKQTFSESGIFNPRILQNTALSAMALLASLALSAQAGTRATLSSALTTHGSHDKGPNPMTSARTYNKILFPDSTYMIDDGTAEDSIGLTSDGDLIALNEFTVTPGNSTITKVSIAWGTPFFPDPTLNGLSYTAVIWSDPNGDGDPSDAVVLATAPGTVAQAGTDTFIDTSFNTTIPTTNFFVGFLITHAAGQHPAALDKANPLPNRSYVAGGATGDINNLTNNDLPVAPIESVGLVGNWLIRAAAGSATPPPTPTPTATPAGQLWYNGDFNGVNGLNNEQDDDIGAGEFAHVYDDFIVTDADGWDVSSVYSNNLADTNVTGATWEIRQGISEGNGGTVVASGMTITPTVTPTGRSGFGVTEFMVEVPDLAVHLDGSNGTSDTRYFLNVTPIGDLTGSSFDSSTGGTNAFGQPPGNNKNAFFDSPFFLFDFASTGDPALGQPYDFSMGVNGTVTGGGGLTLQSAASIKRHGSTGIFDIPLPLTGSEGIEDRAGADTILMTFNNNITNVGTAISTCGNATVRPGRDTHTVLVKLGSAAQCSGQNITVTLSGVMDDQGNTGSATVTYGKLIGDVNADGTVNGKDIKIIRQTAPAQTNSGNFRDDLNADRKINLSDVVVVRRHEGQSLP